MKFWITIGMCILFMFVGCKEQINSISLNPDSNCTEISNFEEVEIFSPYEYKNIYLYRTKNLNLYEVDMIYNIRVDYVRREFDCIKSCPENNTFSGCEIGTCEEKYNTSCIKVSGYTLINNCNATLTATIKFNKIINEKGCVD